jgi:uncharacterized protein (TIGR03382 family)
MGKISKTLALVPMSHKWAICLIVALLAFTVFIPLNSGIIKADSAPLLISGYILDKNDNGVAGATIWLVYGSPYYPTYTTNSSGYYEFYGWATVPVNVYIYPPFDSNYLEYKQQSLTIQPGMTVNFTMSQGYKLSGYIVFQNGTNPSGSTVILNSTWSGTYCNSTGYYFITVAAGTYTIYARQIYRWGLPDIVLETTNTTVTIDKDTTGNIIIASPQTIASPSPTPTATSTATLLQEPTNNPTSNSISAPTQSPNNNSNSQSLPTPSAPEFSASATLPLLLATAVSLLLFRRHRKTANRSK